MPEPTDWDAQRARNTARAEEGDYSCVFDSDDDPQIPEGSDCGGCSCHLAAPCHHCLAHLDPDESDYIGLMLDLQGRSTR